MARHAGDLLGPGRRVSFDVVVIRGAVGVVQATFQPVVGQRQIVDAGDQSFAAVRQAQTFYRQLVQQDLVQRHAVKVLALGFYAAKIREAHLGYLVMNAHQAELQLHILLALAFTLFQVPFALLAPTETDGPLRRHQFAAALVDSNGFPLRIVFLPQAVHQIGGAQQAAGGVITCFTRLQHDQHRHIGVAAHIVAEITDLAIQVEFFQHHVAHRQRHSAVGPLLGVQPLVAQLGHFGVVRRHRHGFSAFVAHFGEEMGIRGASLRHVRAPGDDIGGIVPVGRFRHVGLLAPGHRRSRWQIAIPIVEAQAGAADQ
ncbi:hypothetical protein D3C79_145500 [compost metagenome]